MAEFTGIKVGTVMLEVLPEVQQRAFKSAAISAGTQMARDMGHEFGKQLNSQLQKEATPALTRMGQSAREAAGHIVSGMNQASLAVSRLSTQIALTAFGFQLIGQNIMRYVTLPLAGATVAVMKFGLDSAASLEKNAILWKNVTGSAKGYEDKFKDLVKLAQESPVFEVENLTKYSAQLVSAGYEVDKINPLMRSLGNLFLSQGLDAQQASQSLLALTQMYAKGRISGQELNIQLRNAFPGAMKIFNEAAKNLGVASVEELIQAIDDGKITMNQFFDQLTKIGASEATLKAAADATGGLAASWQAFKESLKVKIASAFLDENFRVKPEVMESFKRIETLVKDLAEAFVRSVPEIIAWVDRILDKVEDLKQKWDELDPKTRALIANLTGMAAAAGPAATALGIVGIMAGTLVRGLAFFALNPMGIVITGIAVALAGLGLAFIALYNDSEEFRKGVAAFVEEVRVGWEEKIKPAFESLKKTVKEDLIPAMEDLLKSLGFDSWEEFGRWLGVTVVDGAVKLIEKIEKMVEWFTKAIEQITAIIVFFKDLKQTWDNFSASLQEKVALARIAWDLFVNGIKVKIDEWKLKFDEIRNKVSEVFTWLETSAQDTVKRFVDGVRNKFQDFATGVATIMDGVKNSLNNIWNDIINNGRAKINSLIDLVNGVIRIINKIPFITEIKELPHLGAAAAGGIEAGRSKFRRRGGPVEGGPRGIDTVPAIGPGGTPYRLDNGEHILTRKEVQKMGGHGNVYAFRQQLMRGYKDGVGLWPVKMAGGGRVGAQNSGLLDAHRDHVHVAMNVPPMGFPAIIALARASGIPHQVGSTFRPGSRADNGNLDHHSTGRAVDFPGFNQDRFASFWERVPGVIELIHRTATRDYGIFGGGGGRGIISFLATAAGKLLKKALDGALEPLKRAIPDPAGGILPAAIHGLFKEIPSKALDHFMSAADTGGGAAAPEQVRKWIAEAGKYVNIEWVDGLATLIMRESGGNPRAINMWDSNAAKGTPSKGLMQTIDPTFQAYRNRSLPNDPFHPIANIVAGMNYIHARYGSLRNVQQAHAGRAPQGYDDGGWLQPGRTVVDNKTGVPEPVFTSRQWEVLKSNISSQGMGDIDISLVQHEDYIEAVIRRNDEEKKRIFKTGRRP